MTRHSAHTIAGIAARAGFTGNSIAEAVSIALSNSHGDDAYDYLANSVPLIHYRGLFGLSVADYSPEDAHMLYDPAFSAEKLYQMYRMNHSKWPALGYIQHGLDPVRVADIRTIIGSRTLSKPLEEPSKLARMSYHQQHLNGR